MPSLRAQLEMTERELQAAKLVPGLLIALSWHPNISLYATLEYKALQKTCFGWRASGDRYPAQVSLP